MYHVRITVTLKIYAMPKPSTVSKQRTRKHRTVHKKTAMIRARVDPALKERAETTFAEVGLSASTAITLFYTQVVRHHGLPFDVRAGAGGPGDGGRSNQSAWSVLQERMGTVVAPTDWASEHDHYIHGTTKHRSPQTNVP